MADSGVDIEVEALLENLDKAEDCNCSKGMRYHALNCPYWPGRMQIPYLTRRYRAMRKALEEIARDGCEMESVLEEIGRPEKNCREAYTRQQWCEACVASAALDDEPHFACVVDESGGLKDA